MIVYSVETKPAILGGRPLSPQRLGIVRPCFPTLEQVAGPVGEILHTGNLTNHSRYVREFESALAERLSVPHALAVNNATSGLILALAGLRLEGEVILPSFTFSATAHALRWNGLRPVFVDILPDTFTLDPVAVEVAITSRTAGILPVHIYGQPCEVDELAVTAMGHGLALLFDAAHAFGSRYRGRLVGGFGDAEVFSFHATKIFPAGEGGCITTRHAALADFLAAARKFGDPGDENTLFPGMNAKMQEFNAILGLAALKVIDQHIENRRRYAGCLIERLGRLPGIAFQSSRPYAATNYQNFAILVDPVQFGLSRDDLYEALAAENILPRKYFHPPLHRHQAYLEYRDSYLPITERISSQVLCLPFYSEMSQDTLELICLAIERVHSFASEIRKQLH